MTLNQLRKNNMEILFEMYGGEVKGKFLGPTEDKPNRHMYYVDGKRKTGVTTALNIKDKSNALMSWQREEVMKFLLPTIKAGKKITKELLVTALYESNKTKDKAADLGSVIHEWCEAYINHQIDPKKHPMPEMPEDANVQVGATSFLEWVDNHKVKFISSEQVFYSKKHDYIGTGDIKAHVDGKLCLCDIKTGNGLYNSVRAQTAAYAKADEEESGVKYDGRWAIRLSKETEDEYLARMALKNEIRGLLGQKPAPVEPYQVFEAMFLDDEGTEMDEDFAAFVNHWELLQWDKKTDFWKVKNGR